MLIAFICVAAITVGAQARPASVAGKWRMTIDFPDRPQTAGLELKQDGRKVTGRFIASFVGGDVPLEGELVDATLTFSASTTGGPHPGIQLDFSGSLKDDRTLTGSLSAPFGDFRWAAERLE